ncbi:helicase HerA domain-containing protein [Pyrococcus yayanosii]|uniref:PLD phosphodiesterase domain-containing protein n=1 Tax=Pyrococcus yayanosii (strain CH1 / JCM 16557) TaxID=529709 RepID=F8AGJ0_PYRYC|nr:DUF87 domain-containing protein [Pyrococcus yayanosii]AEH25194.1 hypothetical protein PYCH_15280 [Pyrococcus yayanosii CH1]
MVRIIPSHEILDTIVGHVKQAENEILISSAWITPQGIQAVLNSAKEGIKLKVLLRVNEPRDLQITESEVFKLLKSYKGKLDISMAFHSNLHAKFIVIDEKYAIVGSANITHSGLSPSEGNVETAVLVEEREEVQKLREYFYKIWNAEVAHGRIFIPDDDIVGFISNPSRSDSIEILLIDDPKVFEGSFLVFHSEGRKYLARVNKILGWNMGFFLNPFTQEKGSILFPSPNEFKFIFDGQKVKEWQMAALIAYLNQKDSNVCIATAKILGYLDGKNLKPSLMPPKVGIPVRKAKREDLHGLLLKGEKNIYIGVFASSDIEAYINLDEIRSKHLAILGTTGSGKSYFAKKFITRASEHLNSIYVLDPHGEYAKDFMNFGFEDFEEVVIPNTVLFFSPDKVEDFLKDYGFIINKRTNEGRALAAAISKWTKSAGLGGVSKGLFNAIGNIGIEDFLREEFGDDALNNQGEVLEKINSAINNSTKKVVVFNLRNIDSPEVRTEIAGYILRKLFIKAKNSGDFNSLVVLEEAHNFAPERGYGEASAGKSNLAKVYAQKIASEGRKFGLGLVVISQRPAQVSKYVLSQMNTQVLFRIVNKSDLDAITSSIESASRDIIEKLSDLKTGYAFITGVSIPVSAIVEVK